MCLDAGLRLRGLLSVGGVNPGMDLNFNHSSTRMHRNRASCFPNAPIPTIGCCLPLGMTHHRRLRHVLLRARREHSAPGPGDRAAARREASERGPVLVGVTAKGVVTAACRAATPS